MAANEYLGKTDWLFITQLLQSEYAKYVRAVEGMGLSANDFTNALKEKLDSIDISLYSKLISPFGDYSYYNIGDRGARSFSVLRELFAGNGMIGYVAKERVDGLLVLPEAVQILGLKDATSTASTPKS